MQPGRTTLLPIPTPGLTIWLVGCSRKRLCCLDFLARLQGGRQQLVIKGCCATNLGCMHGTAAHRTGRFTIPLKLSWCSKRRLPTEAPTYLGDEAVKLPLDACIGGAAAGRELRPRLVGQLGQRGGGAVQVAARGQRTGSGSQGGGASRGQAKATDWGGSVAARCERGSTCRRRPACCETADQLGWATHIRLQNSHLCSTAPPVARRRLLALAAIKLRATLQASLS